MSTDTEKLAEKYYTYVREKNAEGIKGFLHPEVEFYGPLASLKGAEPVFEATSNFMNAITSLEIRAKFGSDDQAMVVYEVDFPGVMDGFPGASLLNFCDGKIVRIQLFYDGSRMSEKKDEIFEYTERDSKLRFWQRESSRG